jgi:hypothetical protein
MDTNSIFITQEELNKDISGKLTLTNVIEMIPKDSVRTCINNWQQQYNSEWRWRFLKFPDDRLTVEISYQQKQDNFRMYFNKYGEWVRRDIPVEVDVYVVDSYYYYTL